jgi:hypothetical protein
MDWLNTFKRWDEESRKQWEMAWHGSRQDDSPAGREADRKASEAFAHLTSDQKASLEPNTAANYELAAEEQNQKIK